MKAMVVRRYGGPEELVLEELEAPRPGPGQVKVKVHATTINDYDWSFLRGKPHIYRLMYGLIRPKKQVLGTELAGVVEAVGEGVTRFGVGARVFGDVSEAGFGAFAEFACVDPSALLEMPAGMSFEQAATLPHAGGLAAQGLLDLAKLERGERVLINGAGGGVGMFGLQIARHFGCEVTGVDSGAKLSMMREAGFDHVLDYRETNFTQSGETYDVILDAHTTEGPRALARALKQGGRYVTVGGHLPKLLSVALFGSLVGKSQGKSLRLLVLKPNARVEFLTELLSATGFRSVIEGPYPFEQLPRAMELFGSAAHRGKVVVTLS